MFEGKRQLMNADKQVYLYRIKKKFFIFQNGILRLKLVRRNEKIKQHSTNRSCCPQGHSLFAREFNIPID